MGEKVTSRRMGSDRWRRQRESEMQHEGRARDLDSPDGVELKKVKRVRAAVQKKKRISPQIATYPGDRNSREGDGSEKKDDREGVKRP